MTVRLSVVVLAALMASGAAQAGEVASITVAPSSQISATAVLLGAKPMPLPRPAGKISLRSRQNTEAAPALRRSLSPRLIPGNVGGPALTPVQIVPDGDVTSRVAPITPQAANVDGAQFSTARVELTDKAALSSLYPYRATGRLNFSVQGKSTWCSASMIGKGLLLTAAHCVAEFGSGTLLPNANWTFVPGYHKGKGAYGVFQAQAAFAPQSYVDGTAPCIDGVVCPNDVAVLVLKPNSKKKYAGSQTGWLGVSYDGYGYSRFLGDGLPAAQIGQLGYPSGIDEGKQMIRNDSLGFADRINEGGVAVDNTLLSSPLNRGSSGGPWVVNLGIKPNYNGLKTPELSDSNMVVGVTSWGYDDDGSIATMGASPITSDNLGPLVNAACAKYPAACTK